MLTTDKRLAREQSPLHIAVIALDDNRPPALLKAYPRMRIRTCLAGDQELCGER